MSVFEQPRSETDLRESESRFRSAFDDAATGMALVALDGSYIRVNQALCEMLGYTEAELLSLSFLALTHPDDIGVDQQALSQMALGKSQVFRRIKRYIHKLGHTIWGSVSTSAVRGEDGRPRYFVTQVQDTTARKQAEAELIRASVAQRAAIAELEAVSQAKSDFIALVSHEFRSVLAGIQAYSELMSEFNLAPEVMQRYARGIFADTQHLSRLISETLDLDHIETERIDFTPELIDLNALLTHVTTLTQASTPQHLIQLCLDRQLPQVWGDHSKLVHVVETLVDNAIHYSPGGGAIEISSRMEQGMAAVKVRDYGSGIPHSALERVFDAYMPSDTGPQTYIKGTGLRLPIAQRIIKLHGGRIWAEPAQGSGSIFHFTLPLLPATLA